MAAAFSQILGGGGRCRRRHIVLIFGRERELPPLPSCLEFWVGEGAAAAKVT